MHFRREPVDSTRKLIAEAPLEKLETGTRAVVEIVGYPEGQFRLTTSEISGAKRSRSIRQRGFLMFRDADEAKDALDALVDRLGAASGSQTDATTDTRDGSTPARESRRPEPEC